MKIKKLLYIICILAMTMLCITACDKERKEEQAKLRLQGIAYLDNGDYEEALGAFQAALDASLGTIGETELDICYYKAKAQALSGDTEGAIATYSAIINYEKNPKAYFLRGTLYYSLEDEENALADYEAAVKYEKADYELYIGIFEAMSAHNKKTEGLEYLEQALKIEGNSSYDKMQKGRIRFLIGKNVLQNDVTQDASRYEEAIADLKAAAEGKEPEAYYYLAEVYLELGDKENAISTMNAYTSSKVADAYKLYNIAKTQITRENYDVAITCLEAARKSESVPNKQSVLKALVVAYEKSLNYPAAREVLQEYVKLYPEDDEAAKELTFLETR